jgi:nitrate/TMAO reductase-like tetraheme cytochrome c subunit
MNASEKIVGVGCLLLAILMFQAYAEEKKTEIKPLALKQFKIDRTVSQEAQGCIDCHAEQNHGLVADWANSRHAHVNVTCIDCHAAKETDADVSETHKMFSKTLVSAIVSPKDCSRCHPSEAAEYDRSKHARTLDIAWKIDIWLNDGLNSELERRRCF